MNKRIVSYSVVSARDQWELEDRINKYIKDRWQPLGGVTVASNLGNRLHQAMVQYYGDTYQGSGR